MYVYARDRWDVRVFGCEALLDSGICNKKVRPRVYAFLIQNNYIKSKIIIIIIKYYGFKNQPDI